MSDSKVKPERYTFLHANVLLRGNISRSGTSDFDTVPILQAERFLYAVRKRHDFQ